MVQQNIMSLKSKELIYASNDTLVSHQLSLYDKKKAYQKRHSNHVIICGQQHQNGHCKLQGQDEGINYECTKYNRKSSYGPYRHQHLGIRTFSTTYWFVHYHPNFFSIIIVKLATQDKKTLRFNGQQTRRCDFDHTCRGLSAFSGMKGSPWKKSGTTTKYPEEATLSAIFLHEIITYNENPLINDS